MYDGDLYQEFSKLVIFNLYHSCKTPPIRYYPRLYIRHRNTQVKSPSLSTQAVTKTQLNEHQSRYFQNHNRTLFVIPFAELIYHF